MVGRLSGEHDPQAWRWLGAIAAEQVLGRSVLAKLRAPAPALGLDAWLEARVASGVLVARGPARAPGLTSSPAREPTFGLAPDLEQLVLRELTARGELHDVALETQALLGGRSVSGITTALQDGDLGLFLRRVAQPRLPRDPPPRSVAEWLRASLCEPFDAAWFERVWERDVEAVALRVLAEHADAPRPCAGLAQWAGGLVGHVDQAGDPGEDEALRGSVELTSVLCQIAIARGDLPAAMDLAAQLPTSTALGFRAAARFLAGDRAGAQQILDDALGAAGPRAALARWGAVAPLLAMLLRARDTADGEAAARRVIGAGATEGQRAAARVFRVLLRHLDQPDVQHKRLHVHQLDLGAGAWETLLSALTVHLDRGPPAPRSSWAEHLVRKALQWEGAGALWLARHAMALARALEREHAEGELARWGLDASALAARPDEPSPWELLAPKPDWKSALDALAEVSTRDAASAEPGARVAWIVDMTDGRFARPSLQESHPGSGWSAGRRVSLGELHAMRERLPREDLAVLRCSRPAADGERELLPEAHEALIGHPRVVDGPGGMAPVDVIRGTCRVETQEHEGFIRVVVEPAGARLGVHVVAEDRARLAVYRVTPAMARVVEVVAHGLSIPSAHEHEVVRVLAELARTVEVRSGHLGAEREVTADPTPCLRIAPHAGAWSVQLGVRPFGEKGRFFVAGSGRASLTTQTAGRKLRCSRDLALERARVERLLAACPSLHGDPEARTAEDGEGQGDHWILGEVGVLSLLAEVRDCALPCAVEWPVSPAMRLRGMVRSRSLHARLRSRKGWYLATGGVRVDDVTDVALADLVRAPFVAGGRFLRLPGGDWVEVEERVRRVIATLAASARRGAEIVVHPGALAALQAVAGPESAIELDAAAADWLARVARLAEQTFPVPAAFCATLRPYQLDGFRWMQRLGALGLGACLADDMGLGKTLQILAVLVARADDGPALVVAPTSVCSNWALELARFAPTLTVVDLAGDGRGPQLDALPRDGAVVICSYAILQQDEARLAAISWSTAVLDEAQFIKNPDSLRARAASKLQARQRIAATGTPVENHVGDLWSIFRFLEPGLLGDWEEFMRRFVRPIERDGSVAAQDALRALVRPYVLRRLKRDVLAELPPVTEVRHDVHLTPGDTLRYGFLRKQIHEKLFSASGKRGNKIEVLAEITRLRRFCCHPRLVFPDAESESAKIRSLLDLVSELRENGHRALVFSQWVDFLGMVREQLDEHAITYEYLDGSTPRAERQARVDAFQNGSATLFLISLKAGGFGLNLTAADYVIHLDPWWNPAVEAQATDRAHRIGQERRVTVYRLITRDTIEESIALMHEKKERTARAILEGTEQAGEIDADALVALISSA